MGLFDKINEMEFDYVNGWMNGNHFNFKRNAYDALFYLFSICISKKKLGLMNFQQS